MVYRLTEDVKSKLKHLENPDRRFLKYGSPHPTLSCNLSHDSTTNSTTSSGYFIPAAWLLSVRLWVDSEGQRLLGNGMLVRAEEEARGSGSGQQPKAQSKSEEELLGRLARMAISMTRVLLLLCLCIAVAMMRTAEATGGGGYMKYKVPKQPLNARIKDLLGRMTLEEKIGQMTQIDRTVASFQVMIYAAGTLLVKKIGDATALEVRATGIPYIVAPCIVVCRDPRWGRCYESYSEDHKVVQAMTQIIPGLQGDIPPNSRKGVPL